MFSPAFPRQMVFPILLTLVILLELGQCCSNETIASSSSSSSSAEEPHSRAKRFLSFVVNGGVAKIILGGIYPVFFHHKLKRSLNAAVNVQANYVIPETIIWPVAEDVFKERLNNEFVDNSRVQLYKVLESMLDSWGRKGRTCVLRTICEVAETPVSHNGMFGEILDVIFTPTESDKMDEEYRLARKYGLHGVNCSGVYSKCPSGHGLLDLISTVDLFNFNL
ncbi:uncharacterized protein LOC129757708 [Uranotaenia lowii]|uniref:uncharacterized protein LOC129757708 n=1 Tax=Uranotaenia lowii TaxID=190385 RepID=UPI002478702D|nr:uncharacterized protein LOC129757708 [Uranotaenia lowii]